MRRAEELAAELEAACGAFADYVAGLSPEEWRARAANHPEIRVGQDERRPVGVVAHHVGDTIPLLAEVVRRRATGELSVPLSPADVDAINERHAAGNERPDQPETVAMIRDNATHAAAVIRALSDEQLDRSASGERSPAEVIRRVMIGHVAWHQESIRASRQEGTSSPLPEPPSR